ncbi:DUF397 domain-containing protein [Streptomyces nanshensis]|uniref:Toxin n=1 Tax=Streptomyces nanshensis TaxID=518642 RepID=A0A1E7KQE7_9ACTN|nr:DUF397 domain-containing protein [Streptomyces nanshensis]OEV06155.1 toxin [Streptomyces nanshensis]
MSGELVWFKSSYSNDEGGACVEVALAWRTSSYSNDEGGECVEVAACPCAVHVRDSKQGTRGSQLTFLTQAWSAFLRGGHSV